MVCWRWFPTSPLSLQHRQQVACCCWLCARENNFLVSRRNGHCVSTFEMGRPPLAWLFSYIQLRCSRRSNFLIKKRRVLNIKNSKLLLAKNLPSNLSTLNKKQDRGHCFKIYAWNLWSKYNYKILFHYVSPIYKKKQNIPLQLICHQLY